MVPNNIYKFQWRSQEDGYVTNEFSIEIYEDTQKLRLSMLDYANLC